MGRRAETTEYLKECIADALITLMQDNPIEKIKIQEITDLAKVGRVTYFRNFNSKTEVLIFKLLMLWKRWDMKHLSKGNVSNYEMTYNFFCFCLSIRSLLKTLYDHNLQFALLNLITEYAISSVPSSDSSKQYINTFIIYGMYGFVSEWLKRDFAESPEELAQLISSTTFS